MRESKIIYNMDGRENLERNRLKGNIVAVINF